MKELLRDEIQNFEEALTSKDRAIEMLTRNGRHLRPGSELGQGDDFVQERKPPVV